MKVIGFHTLHDANVAVVEDGRVCVVLELERLFEKRYFCSDNKAASFELQWRQALAKVENCLRVSNQETGNEKKSEENLMVFDVAVTSWVMPSQKVILQRLVQAKKWVHKDHHWCHAALAFYDSPFDSALIVSYDGGGNDGSFMIFEGQKTTRQVGNGVMGGANDKEDDERKEQQKDLRLIKKVKLNLGTPYRQLAIAMPEVHQKKNKKKKSAEDEKKRDEIVESELSTNMRFAPLALSGKVMGYAALGKIRPEWVEPVREYYLEFITPLQALFTLGERLGICLEPNAITDVNVARDLAATSQHVFESLLIEKICDVVQWPSQDANGIYSGGDCSSWKKIGKIGEKTFIGSQKLLEEECAFKARGNVVNLPQLDGICLTGGCALNVNGNQKIVEVFRSRVHVPPAPGDCGIAVGACFLVDTPSRYTSKSQNLSYVGTNLFDLHRLPAYVQMLKKPRRSVKPRKVSIEELAHFMVHDGAIIGVVRGRQEFGPRALGNRSIICFPNRAHTKGLINTLKDREWFRPLCPSITEESWNRFFETLDGQSPYMSFAPMLRKEMSEKFPAIAHLDGSARVQTVSKESNQWYHALLRCIGREAGDLGYEICLNTSFNVNGKPILNTIADALDILDTPFKDQLVENLDCSTNKKLLDYVVVEAADNSLILFEPGTCK
eukprot:Nk52_evm38s2391 gene=Nk52_evmTU38s2391